MANLGGISASERAIVLIMLNVPLSVCVCIETTNSTMQARRVI